jgi:Ca2+-binding RTX toxin-like protein
MRRIALLLATTMGLALLLAGVALAASFTCTTNPCKGTSGPDTITGTINAETINGLAGDDDISALDGNDKINGGANNDTTSGGNGNDSYRFWQSPFGADRISDDASGADTLDFTKFPGFISYNMSGPQFLCPSTASNCVSLGGNFIEKIKGTPNNDAVTGNSLNNNLNLGAGDDLYAVLAGWKSDTIVDSGGTDAAIVDPDAGAMPNVTFNLVPSTGPEVTDGTNRINWSSGIENAQGGPGNDTFKQSPATNTLFGLGGGDTYQGYGPGFGEDLIADDAGSNSASPGDKLDLGAFKLADAGFFYARNLDGIATWLVIDFADGSTLFVQDYFGGTNARPCNQTAGVGYLETIAFADDPNVDLAQAKTLVGCAGAASGVAQEDGSAQEFTNALPEPSSLKAAPKGVGEVDESR